MDKGKEKKNIKEIIITILSVLILIIAVFGISYSIWTQTFLGSKENSINTGYISFSYTESDTNVIEMNNAVPMSDENGKKLTGNNYMFDFTVSAKYGGVSSIGYEIYATPINQTLDSQYLKVYLTDQKDQAIPGYESTIPTYNELEDSTMENSKTIYKSTLNHSGASQDFRLRIWVSSDYNTPETSNKFSFKVNVKGVA